MATADKLTYLNETKSQLKDMINYGGGNITSSTTFRNYVKALFNAFIESLNNPETLWNNLPHITGTGTEITLNDTIKAPMKVDLKGNTSQVQYTGKNKLQNTGSTQKINGLTFTKYEDGTIKVNGTASEQTTYNINENVVLSGDYIINGCPSGGADATYFLQIYGTGGVNEYGNGATTSNINAVVRIVIRNDATLNNLIFKPMIRLSSVSDTSYEPYVGGTASPNPSYPSPVNVVSGDNTIDICAKNLLDYTNLEQLLRSGAEYTIIDNGVQITNLSAGGYRYVVFNLGTTEELLGKTLRFKANFVNSDNNGGCYTLAYCDSDGGNRTVMQTTYTSGETISSGVITNTNTNVCLMLMVNNNSTSFPVGTYTRFTNLMLTIDNEDMTYEPYIGNTYPIYLGVENLCSSAVYYSTNAMYMYFNPKKIEQTFTISLKAPKTLSNVNVYVWADNTNLGRKGYIQLTNEEIATATFTLNERDYESLKNSSTGFLSLYLSGANFDTTGTIEEPQIENNSKANSYTPFGTTPIELCKIGTYQDYIYKYNGSWYLHKEIEKAVLDGSEDWRVNGTGTPQWFYQCWETPNFASGSTGLSNYYKWNGNISASNTNQGFLAVGNHYRFRYGTEDTIANHKSWISTHNIIIYHPIPNPIITEITNTNLISQLEALRNAESYEGQTNISQENNDLPFILNVTALEDLN